MALSPCLPLDRVALGDFVESECFELETPLCHRGGGPRVGKREFGGSLGSPAQELVSGDGRELEGVPTSPAVSLFPDNQQKQGVHMGVHQGSAGRLVGLAGDAAHRPAGGYVCVWGGGAARPEVPGRKCPARSADTQRAGCLDGALKMECFSFTHARDSVLEIPESKIHDRAVNTNCHQQGGAPVRSLESWDCTAAGPLHTVRRRAAILDLIGSARFTSALLVL